MNNFIPVALCRKGREAISHVETIFQVYDAMLVVKYKRIENRKRVNKFMAFYKIEQEYYF